MISLSNPEEEEDKSRKMNQPTVHEGTAAGPKLLFITTLMLYFEITSESDNKQTPGFTPTSGAFIRDRATGLDWT